MTEEKTPYGYCHCGCGKRTKISKRNYISKGTVAGEPYKYIRGHTSNKRVRFDIQEGYAWCSYCKKQKSVSEFHTKPSRRTGLQPHCKECQTKVHLLWVKHNRKKSQGYSLKVRLRQNFGITPEEYEKMLEEQDHRCAICHYPEIINSSGIPRLMSVDHDHKTGRVRGLLCTRCNGAMGWLRDDVEIIKNMVAYL